MRESVHSDGQPVDISVVCPFYNEAGIIEHTVRKMLEQLRALDATWELIVVNDGSTDGAGAIAERLAGESPHLRVIGYPQNRGRGYALRTGIAAARGEIIVTTEIDLSWGERIIHDLVAAMRSWPEADIVVASPHLPGGGYRNVPAKRVWLSRIGNRVIRAAMSNAVTMNTGMTRAYRRDIIQSLPLFEDEKEFHLEVILKATAFGFRIREIPAILAWTDERRAGQALRRKTSSRINRLVVSHTLFSLSANPVRYVWALSLLLFVMGLFWFGLAAVFWFRHLVSAYAALTSFSLFTMAFIFFVLGIVVKQGYMIQRELWTLQHYQLRSARSSSDLLNRRLEAGQQETADVPGQPTASR